MADYLSSAFELPVRDPVWGNIGLTPEFKRLTDETAFQHLAGIRQLGPSYLVYPGAVHTRLAHSLGVFHLARRLLLTFAGHEEELILDRDEITIFLAAALLHDLGHFPFAHSFKDLPLKKHEEITAEIISSSRLAGVIRRELGIDPELVAAVIDHDLPVPAEKIGERIRLFRRLLSGVLDPDKLDYLNRDAFFCGVPYGNQDVDNILDCTRILPSGKVGVDACGTVAVENLLFSKYLMYRTVYWHKTVRIATAMIKQAVMMALTDGKIKPEALYGLDDDAFCRMAGETDYPPLELVASVRRRHLYKMVTEFDEEEGELLINSLSASPEERLEASIQASSRLSSLLGRDVSPEQIIIDIPEPISFETDMDVLQGGREIDFVSSGTLFTTEVVGQFARSLRKLRICAEPSLAERLSVMRQDKIMELFL
ncbi:HD domain-containing protein [Sediminispirochaeta bajacaliforniensis]|uniref:HD domain-containing protein n=1 Tax=Sediminispirochaeta bajacaliforniensis TaxID=148 RepID=UPI0003782CE5|nr:HD domain-containing protein [Sediminispirochaeta bajacaliforniensis]